MKVYNTQNHQPIGHGLLQTLEILRARRSFVSAKYLKAKCLLLNDYMTHNHLSACVIGLSGGVDSAVVVSLVLEASRMAYSPIKRIIPLIIPVHTKGATNQKAATNRAMQIVKQLQLQPSIVDLTQSQMLMKTAVDSATTHTGNEWAEGQLASYIRTPALYYTTAILNQQGLAAIVVGTTNRDEGAYIGYFGKASDTMVDIQLISDLHKSEVFAIARALNVPQAILDTPPSGDMYDGRTDEEMFGTSYDAVELCIGMRCLHEKEATLITANWGDSDKEQYKIFQEKLGNLHQYNAHKYKVGSPAIHLDVMESSVPGGWQHHHKCCTAITYENKPSAGNFVAPFELTQTLLNTFNVSFVSPAYIKRYMDDIWVIEHLLDKKETDSLRNEVLLQNWLPVGMNGRRKDYKEGDTIGSWRASTYSTDLSHLLWNRLTGKLPMLITSEEQEASCPPGVWKAIGVNPLFRFIQYKPGGALIGHYDAPYDYGDGRITLYSFIIYLTTHSTSAIGATRFLKDKQKTLPETERNYSDWKRTAMQDEVLLSIVPSEGGAIIFPHRTLHDCAPLSDLHDGEHKIILRSDIIYQKVSYR